MKPPLRSLAALPTAILLALLAVGIAITGDTRAAPAIRYVSTVPNCGGNSPCYSSVQDALDAANPGNQIYVATGTYTDAAGTVADIDQTVTLLGGWNASFTTRDPDTYITTLDAQRGGHAVEIIGVISPTVDGFVITGGDATGESVGYSEGGGICSRNASPIISNNVITNNIASTHPSFVGKGGGIFLLNASTSALISGNEIVSNTASTGYVGYGGGIHIQNCDPTVTGNTVQENVGSSSASYDGKGGGLYLSSSGAMVSDNDITDNDASTDAGGEGGGVMLYSSDATLDSNRIIDNGVHNVGGGVSVDRSDGFVLINNIIARNRSKLQAGGFYAWGMVGYPARGRLINNTFADNNVASDVEAVRAQIVATLTLTNNIICGSTYGIYAESVRSLVTADHTVFYNNTSGDTGGSGTVVSTNAINGDPLFVNPSSWDYRISATSAAVNEGTFDGAPGDDFQGDTRPYDCFIDIGADENTSSDLCLSVHLPLAIKRY